MRDFKPNLVPHRAPMTIAFIAWLAAAPAVGASTADGEIIIRPPGEADVALATRDTVAEITSRLATRLDIPLEEIGALRRDYTACLRAAERETDQNAESSCHVAMLDGRISAIDTIAETLEGFEGDLSDLLHIYRDTKRGFEEEVEVLAAREAETRRAGEALFDVLEDMHASGQLEGLTRAEELQVEELIVELEIQDRELAFFEQEQIAITDALESFAMAEENIAAWQHGLARTRIGLEVPRRESELSLERFHRDARLNALLGEDILPPELAKAAEDLSVALAFAEEDLPTVGIAEGLSRRHADAVASPPAMSGGNLADRVGALLESRRGPATRAEGGE